MMMRRKFLQAKQYSGSIQAHAERRRRKRRRRRRRFTEKGEWKTTRRKFM